MRYTSQHRRGLTLMELLLAAALLAACAVPIVEATTHALNLSQEIETRTKATLLAQHEMEAAMAIAAEDFDQTISKDSEDLGDGFLVTISGVRTDLRKTFTVEVGHDANGNSQLDADEVLVAFVTRVADMTTY